MTNLRVLVTGAGGAIGFHLGKALADAGHEVHLVDNFNRSQRDRLYTDLANRSNVVEHVIDLCEWEQVNRLDGEFDYIFHLAAMNGTANFYDRPFSVVLNSTLPTLNLIRRYKDSDKLKRFIYAGSSEAYASTVTLFDWEVPTGEDVPLTIADVNNPRWSYATSKLHGEIACIAASVENGMPFTVVRFHNVYGPRMGDKHVIPDFIERALKGEFELFGWEDTRTFIYVSDAIEATIALAFSADSGNEVVNIGGEQEISMKSLGEAILAVMGISADITLHPSPIGSVARRAPKLDKLRAITGFSQRVSLHDGLATTFRYIKNPSKFEI